MLKKGRRNIKKIKGCLLVIPTGIPLKIPSLRYTTFNDGKKKKVIRHDCVCVPTSATPTQSSDDKCPL